MDLNRSSNLPLDVVAETLSGKLPQGASVRQDRMTNSVRVVAGRSIYEMHVDEHYYRITDAGGTGIELFDFSDWRTFSYFEDAVRAMARLAGSETFGAYSKKEDGTEAFFNVPSWTLTKAAEYISDPDSDWWDPGEPRHVAVWLNCEDDSWSVSPCGQESFDVGCAFKVDAQGIIPGSGARYANDGRADRHDASSAAA